MCVDKCPQNQWEAKCFVSIAIFLTIAVEQNGCYAYFAGLAKIQLENANQRCFAVF